jgi:hypothetical protein
MKKVDRKRLFILHNKKDLRQFVINIQYPHKIFKRKKRSDLMVIKPNHSTDGNAWWDLRSYNNQEIAPGLYIYVVETPSGEKKIDKFAVVR